MKVKKTSVFSDNRTQKGRASEASGPLSTELRNDVVVRGESRPRPRKEILVNSVTI